MKQGIHPDYHPVVFQDSHIELQSAALHAAESGIIEWESKG